MSNVFSNASFAVLSVMDTTIVSSDNAYGGSVCFIQQKPEADHGNITILPFSDGDFNLVKEDFNVQERFEANVVPEIGIKLRTMKEHIFSRTNSNISVYSYSADGKINT